MFRALLCPSSGARQTAVAASGFRMNVEVEVLTDDGHNDARNKLSSVCTTEQYILRLLVGSSWVFYLSD